MNNKKLTIGLVVAIIISLGAYAFPRTVTVSDLGAATPGTRFPHGVTIGSSGTNNAHVIDTTCNLIIGAVAHPATTTLPYDCNVTGITSSFTVTFAQISTTTIPAGTQPGGFWVVGSKASTTAGKLTVMLYNGTGGTTNPSILSYGSSTSVHAVQTQ